MNTEREAQNGDMGTGSTAATARVWLSTTVKSDILSQGPTVSSVSLSQRWERGGAGVSSKLRNIVAVASTAPPPTGQDCCVPEALASFKKWNFWQKVIC